MRTIAPPALVFLLAAFAVPGHALDPTAFELSLLWSDDQRAFFQDGPGLLLDSNQRDVLLDGDATARQRFIDAFLAEDPNPATPANELLVGIERRRDLVHGEFLSLIDERAQVLFLNGAPAGREIVDCLAVYRELEIWTYPDPLVEVNPKHDVEKDGPAGRKILFYREKSGVPFRLWLPVDGKRVLYNEEMEYYLQQAHELAGFLTGRRFDRQLCDDVEAIDGLTGVDGLFGFQPDRPKNEVFERFLKPPADLAAWAEEAAVTPLDEVDRIADAELTIVFPERVGQRMESEFRVQLPADLELGTVTNEAEFEEVRLVVEGQIERGGLIFETFRMRFLLPPPESGIPVVLIAPRRLRPTEAFLLHLRVEDEVTERTVRFSRGFQVPSNPTPASDLPPIPTEAIVALGDELKRRRVEGYDSLILIPPESDVTFGLWRAEALVTGSNIVKVAFYLDGKPVFKRGRPPFSAELRLPSHPTEQVVRAEGLDANDQILASDEVVLNQPRGQLQVRIVEPARGNKAQGRTPVKVEVVVPEERKVTAVRLSVNEGETVVLERPPWESEIDVPIAVGQQLNYLTVTAELDDGSAAEDVRFLDPPDGIDEVDVSLVELFTTVTDRNGRLVKGLQPANFVVQEDGRPQTIAKFELVQDLPLTLGITIDTSGSMFESLGEAQRAAVAFLDNIITPRDRCFALAFSDRPALLMPRTSDVGAVAERLQSVLASGSTSLHDAVVTSLYYFRGIRGRRALILLSDGEDTSSTIGFSEALEYAKLSGVAIYTIGLGIGRTDISVRRKLENLAQETGGRNFLIKNADELAIVYDEIEEELRSQYLVAYSSDQAGAGDTYRSVQVEVRDAKGKKLEARTIAGYYP